MCGKLLAPNVSSILKESRQLKAHQVIKYVRVFTAVVLLLGACCEMTFAQDYPPDIRKIIDRGKLIVAIYHQDNAPFFMRDSQGGLYGVDIHLTGEIAAKLGVKVEFNCNPATFNEVVDTVARHEADIGIGSLSCTLERAKRVSFTKPYIILHQGLLINRVSAARQKHGSRIMDILQVPDTAIGVQGGTSHAASARERFPRAVIREYPGWKDVLDAVMKGEVAAVFDDEVEVRKLIAARPEVALDLQTVVLKDTSDPIAIAVPWDSANLLSWLNLYLDSLGGKLTVEGILKEYSRSFMPNPG
jgi:polar amino acid transport system substrate-binding protein